MVINIVVDNPKSWMIPYAKRLVADLKSRYKVSFVRDSRKVRAGDCAFYLSCEKIVPKDVLARNRHNLVVHGSALPNGKGWSPLTWQILEGKNEIPVTLFEARERVDSGPIYLREKMKFNGHELIDELRQVQGEMTIRLIKKFLKNYLKIKGRKQNGKESFYPRRTTKDSQLNIHKSISGQFDLLRVVDNERYPAFFRYRDHTYILKIYKAQKDQT